MPFAMPCLFWCLICFGHRPLTSKVFCSILTLGIIQWGRNTSGKCARAHKTPAFWAYLHLHILRWALRWFGTWVYSSYSMSQYHTKALTSPSMQFLQSCWGRTCRCMLMLSNLCHNLKQRSISCSIQIEAILERFQFVLMNRKTEVGRKVIKQYPKSNMCDMCDLSNR